MNILERYWRRKASEWLLKEAEAQRQINKQYPENLELFPEWKAIPNRLKILARQVRNEEFDR